MIPTQQSHQLQSIAQNRVIAHDISQATMRKVADIEAKLKVLDENDKDAFNKLKDELLSLYRAHFDSLSAIAINNEDLGKDE